jgi:hypothetical protein
MEHLSLPDIWKLASPAFCDVVTDASPCSVTSTAV